MMIQYTWSEHQIKFTIHLKKERKLSTKSSNLNYLDTKFNAMEPNIPYDSKVVSTELHEKFNSDIRITFKNQTTDQAIKQMYLSEVMGNLQYSFSMDQLENLEVHPNRMSKYKTDIKDKYQFDLFDWFCSEKDKKKINLVNEKL